MPFHTRQSVAALALEFAVLTVARTNEVLGAKWGEIDAAAILAELAKAKAGDFIFPGQQPGRHLSSLEMIMARMKVDATVQVLGQASLIGRQRRPTSRGKLSNNAWLTLLVATSSGAIGAVISSKSAGLSYTLGAAFAICPIAAKWFRSRG